RQGAAAGRASGGRAGVRERDGRLGRTAAVWRGQEVRLWARAFGVRDQGVRQHPDGLDRAGQELIARRAIRNEPVQAVAAAAGAGVFLAAFFFPASNLRASTE